MITEEDIESIQRLRAMGATKVTLTGNEGEPDLIVEFGLPVDPLFSEDDKETSTEGPTDEELLLYSS